MSPTVIVDEFADIECDSHVAHAPDWPVMAFHCARCKRHVCGWCQGGADDEPELCDLCWVEVNLAKMDK